MQNDMLIYSSGQFKDKKIIPSIRLGKYKYNSYLGKNTLKISFYIFLISVNSIIFKNSFLICKQIRYIRYKKEIKAVL